MSIDKLRVGVIGVGVYAAIAHIPDLRKTGKAEVVAISRRNPERLAMAQQAFNIAEAYADWREMLEKSRLDAVVVSTPHHAHTEPTLAALDRGLHVLLDKPMALTSQDAWTMVEAAEQADRVLMLGYPERTKGIWQTVKRLLQEGVLGQIRQMNLALCEYRRWFWEAETMPAEVTALLGEYSSMPDEFFAGWQDWHRTPAQMGGGMFADTGTHWVDLMLWLAGAPPAGVVAFSESAGLPVEAFMSVQARLSNGVLLSLTSADAVPRGLLSGTRYMMIVGEEGILTSNLKGEVWLHRAGKEERIEAAIPNTNAATAFVAAVAEGKPNPAPAREGAYAVAFIEAAYRSAAERQIIQIDYGAREK